MQILFFSLLLFILMHYVGYPAFIFIISFFSTKRTIDEILQGSEPTVSFIIAAYNEEKVIESKLKNTVQLNYPQGKLEIIVVSDGSQDLTPKIAEGFPWPNLISLFDPIRRGKTNALNKAMAHAKNEILIFSDANNFFRPNAIRKLVRNFSDTKVGGVSGRKTLIKDSSRLATLGDRLFWKFESNLKTRESALGSIPTADGEIFAVRRNLALPLPSHLINDDMAMTLQIISSGHKVVYEPEAISEEIASATLSEDFAVKARMVLGGFQILSQFRELLFSNSFFAVQFFLHKTLRYVMPFLLLALLLSSVFLARKSLFILLFLYCQIVFYFLASLGHLRYIRNKKLGVLYLPYYFCLMNAAALQGALYFLQRRSGVSVWSKATR